MTYPAGMCYLQIPTALLADPGFHPMVLPDTCPPMAGRQFHLLTRDAVLIIR